MPVERKGISRNAGHSAHFADAPQSTRRRRTRHSCQWLPRTNTNPNTRLENPRRPQFSDLLTQPEDVEKKDVRASARAGGRSNNDRQPPTPISDYPTRSKAAILTASRRMPASIPLNTMP
jgi:hypothetical protein